MVHRRIGALFLTAVVCAVSLTGLAACDWTDDISDVIDGPVSGGVIDKTDPNAPKTIESTEISEFYASFYLVGEWYPGSSGQQFSFSVMDEDGVLTLSEPSLELSVPADMELLESLQVVIEKYSLVSRNGVYRVTSGLPPEYANCNVNVLYESGEQLLFTENNDPYDEWSQSIYLTIAEWLSARGDDSLMPPKTEGRIKDLNIEYRPDGSGSLIMFSVGEGNDNTLTNEKLQTVKVTSEYWDKINEIVDKYDVRPFDLNSVLYREDWNGDDFAPIHIYLGYGANRSITINASDPDAVACVKPMLDELIEYNNSLYN